METQKNTNSKTTQKDVQTIITEQVIGHLEKGIVPWRTSWMEAGVPTSLVSKRPFKGLNVLLLASLGYERNVFLTGKQLEKIGGSIKPNEKPHMIVFWSTQEKGAASEAESKTSVLRYYLVYNVSQCLGIPDELVPGTMRETNPVKACEGVVANLLEGPQIRHKEGGTYYDPLEDYINIPKLKSFGNIASYYSSLLHQLVHSSGHHTRLDRMGLVQMSEYGCTRFTQEELVAEIATNYLENFAGIPCLFEPDKEYLDSWIQKLKSDRYFIFNACTLAQKAVDFILNVKDAENAEQTQEVVEEPMVS